MADYLSVVKKCHAMAEAIPKAAQEGNRAGGRLAVEAMNAAAASAGIHPGGPIPRFKGTPWAGAQMKEAGGDVLVGFSNPAQLVIGASKTKEHVIVPKGIVWSKSASGAITTAKFGGKGRRRSLAFGAHPVTIVHNRGSRRKDVWPVAKAEVQRVIPPAVQNAQHTALLNSGFGL